MKLTEYLKKFDLPSKEDLELEFGNLNFDEDDCIIDELVNKIVSKMSFFADILEDLIHPDSTLVAMNEAQAFSEINQKQLFSLFKNLTFQIRKSNLLKLNPVEENKFHYFKESFEFFKSKKEEIELILKKTIDVWIEDENKDKLDAGYFG